MSDISSDDTSSDHSDSDYDSETDVDDNFNPIVTFNRKELCYYKMIDRFFRTICSSEQINKMIDIIRKKGKNTSNISLRILDWFITKYSKHKIISGIESTSELFDIHISYKSQLKTYKKEYFDPFRRRFKFRYNYDTSDPNKKIKTTLGQLNFFKWAISNNIITYVEQHIDYIINTMNVSNKEYKKKKNIKKGKIKPDSPHPSSPKSTNENGDIIIYF